MNGQAPLTPGKHKQNLQRRACNGLSQCSLTWTWYKILDNLLEEERISLVSVTRPQL